MILEFFWDGAWHQAPVLKRDTVVIRRGITSPDSDSDPAGASPTIDNGSGMWAPRSVVSPLYGKIGQNTRARFTVDTSVRLTGEAAEWRPERPIKGSGWTKTRIAGVLERLGTGVGPLESPTWRAGLALDAVSSWPLQDGAGATAASSSIPNGPPLTPGAVSVTPTWADADDLPGAKPAPLMITSEAAFASWPADVLAGPVAGTSATAWSISFWVKAETSSAATVVEILTWDGRPIGAPAPWIVQMFSNAAGFEIIAGYGNAIKAWSLGTGLASSFDGNWHHVVVQAYQSATFVETRMWVDGVLGSFDLTPDVDTLQPVTTLRLLKANNTVPGPVSVWLSQVDVFDTVLSSGEVQTLYRAGLANAGETAADRFSRLCGEQGITATVVGTAAESALMGPQRPITFLELLDEVGRTDDASIFETRDALGLTMRTGASRLNQAPDLTVSYLGQIQPTLSPVVGARGIRNDVTAANPAGATRRVRQLTGPRNVQLPEDDAQGVGQYATRAEVNPYLDDALADIAGWRVNLGVFDGTWYAEVTVDLDAAPGLAAAASALDIGDVIAIADLVSDEALDTVESIIIGTEEEIRTHRRLLTFFCVPADPYRTGLLALASGDTDPFVGSVDTDGSTTVGATAAGAASFSVATPSGPLWTVDADDFPQDVIVGGQRVSISGISGGASPQTFTVQAASLGGRQVVYPIPAGARVNIRLPIILSM